MYDTISKVFCHLASTCFRLFSARTFFGLCSVVQTKKWLIDYYITVVSKTNNFSSFPLMYLTRHTQPSRQAGILVVLHCNRQCHVFWSALVHCSERSPFPLTQSFTEKKYTHKPPPPPDSNWNVDKLFHILYGRFLVIRLFQHSVLLLLFGRQLRLHLWHKYFIDSVLNEWWWWWWCCCYCFVLLFR